MQDEGRLDLAEIMLKADRQPDGVIKLYWFWVDHLPVFMSDIFTIAELRDWPDPPDTVKMFDNYFLAWGAWLRDHAAWQAKEKEDGSS